MQIFNITPMGKSRMTRPDSSGDGIHEKNKRRLYEAGIIVKTLQPSGDAHQRRR